jgi:hypothetical protein
MERFGIGLRVHGNCLDAHLTAGANDANSDLASVGDENFRKHRRLFGSGRVIRWSLRLHVGNFDATRPSGHERRIARRVCRRFGESSAGRGGAEMLPLAGS